MTGKTADIYAQLLAAYSDAVVVHHEAPTSREIAAKLCR